MSVVAPKGGYDFAEKRLYRSQIWNLFRRHIDRPKAAHVMLMPSSCGDEILVAKSKGFRVSNMHIVDSEPAVIANLRRRDYGAFKGYGATASVACGRAAADGVRLKAANFDFTSCVSNPLLLEMIGVAEADCYAPFVVIAVNMLRGREAGAFGDVVCRGTFTDGDANPASNHGTYSLTEADRRRIKFLSGAFSTVSGRLPIKVARGIYRSGNQTMLWFVTAFARGGAAVPPGTGVRVDGGVKTDFHQDGIDAIARQDRFLRTGELMVQGGSPEALDNRETTHLVTINRR